MAERLQDDQRLAMLMRCPGCQDMVPTTNFDQWADARGSGTNYCRSCDTVIYIDGNKHKIGAVRNMIRKRLAELGRE